MRIVIVRICTYIFRKNAGYVFCRFFDSRHDDMARKFLGKLLYAFAQIAFGYSDSVFFEKRYHAAFFLKHRFTFYYFTDMLVAEYAQYNFIMFCCIFSPMYDCPVFFGIFGKLCNILVEMRKGMHFYL